MAVKKVRKDRGGRTFLLAMDQGIAISFLSFLSSQMEDNKLNIIVISSS